MHVSSTNVQAVSDFSTPFTLEIQQDGQLNGLLAWFNTFFTGDSRQVHGDTEQQDMQDGEVTFSTCPGKTGETHWKQTAFIFKQPVSVQQGACSDIH